MKVSLIIFLIGFITIAPSIYVGIKYFDGKVTEQPYETGLMYDQDKKFMQDNGLGIEIMQQEKSGDIVNMKFALSKNSGVVFENPAFFITRPASDQGLIKLDAKADADGAYGAEFAVGTQGYHILKVTAKANGKDICLQKSFYIN